ncbi:hypothetical protein [Acidiphilium sp.]|uniref:hypothetical protein n=1 Tax=Acidiphilium sp. TaxID=527 RepID=UPI003CFF5039
MTPPRTINRPKTLLALGAAMTGLVAVALAPCAFAQTTMVAPHLTAPEDASQMLSAKLAYDHAILAQLTMLNKKVSELQTHRNDSGMRVTGKDACFYRHEAYSRGMVVKFGGESFECKKPDSAGPLEWSSL